MEYRQTKRQQAFSADTMDWMTQDTDWLNPINMQILVDAFKRGDSQVTLDNRVYNLTYNREKDTVYLRRADGGFCPQGTIELGRLRTFDFEGSRT